MMENERVALALIALITGIMGFVESMTAVPAASTAMAADALSFVQHSISAGFLLWATSGTMTRQRWTVQLQGLVMAILGALVCVIAVRRFLIGSVPHPLAMIVIGAIALLADLAVGAIVLRQRRMLRNTYIFASVPLSTRSSSLRVPDLKISIAGKTRLSATLRSRIISELP